MYVKMGDIHEIYLKETLISNYYYYMLDNQIYFPILYKASQDASVKSEFISKDIDDLSFVELLVSKNTVDIDNPLAKHIKTGPSFSQGRYPILLQSTDEIDVIYARCGLEEIVKYNENSVILYFNEYCENGPDI